MISNNRPHFSNQIKLAQRISLFQSNKYYPSTERWQWGWGWGIEDLFENISRFLSSILSGLFQRGDRSHQGFHQLGRRNPEDIDYNWKLWQPILRKNISRWTINEGWVEGEVESDLVACMCCFTPSVSTNLRRSSNFSTTCERIFVTLGTHMKLENYVSNIYVPQMKNKKKGSLNLVITQIWFNLKCLAQCICSKSNSLTFLDNVWFGMFERSLRPVLRVADSP